MCLCMPSHLHHHYFLQQNVLVNENFVHLLEVTCQEHPSLDVQYGGVGGFIAKKPPKRVDPMKVIQVCLFGRLMRLCCSPKTVISSITNECCI